ILLISFCFNLYIHKTGANAAAICLILPVSILGLGRLHLYLDLQTLEKPPHIAPGEQFLETPAKVYEQTDLKPLKTLSFYNRIASKKDYIFFKKDLRDIQRLYILIELV
ncbi:MAG: hypothetical protein KBS68_00990, partial [Clostridiales bacterium]|nr:hypothetical protein [Candidatus Crickella merdequi]